MKKCALLALLFLPLFTASLHAQTWKWAKGSSCSNPNESLDAFPIVVDKSGNVYEAGYAVTPTATMGPVTFTFGAYSTTDSNDAFAQGILVSTDSDGNYRWVLGTYHGYCDIGDLAISPGGDLYLVGYCPFGISLGTKSFTGTNFCAKVHPDGTVVWIKSLADRVNGYGLKIGANGNIYIAGTFSDTSITIGTTVLTNHGSTLPSTDVFIAEFDSSGSPLWATSFGGGNDDKCSGLTLGASDEIFVAGTWLSTSMAIGSTTLTSPGANPFYVAKFSSSGTPLWGKNIAATHYDQIKNIATDYFGNVYLTGQYAYTLAYGPDVLPTPIGYGMFLFKTDGAGVAKWARTTSVSYDGYSVVADACGNIWAAGMINAGGGNTDSSFMVEYDTAGHLLNTVKLAGGGEDIIGLTVDNKGNLFVAADYVIDNEIIGNDTLRRSFPSGEYFSVAKYNYPYCAASLETEPVAMAQGITLFPNPAAESCTIHSETAFATGAFMIIYDMTGRQIQRHGLAGTDAEIPLTGVIPGLYTCKIFNGTTTETRKLTIMR